MGEYQRSKELTFWELGAPRTKATTIILLSRHSTKLSSEFIPFSLEECHSHITSEKLLCAVAGH